MFLASSSVIASNVFQVPDAELWAEVTYRASRAGSQHLPFFFLPLSAVPIPEIQKRIPKPLGMMEPLDKRVYALK